MHNWQWSSNKFRPGKHPTDQPASKMHNRPWSSKQLSSKASKTTNRAFEQAIETVKMAVRSARVIGLAVFLGRLGWGPFSKKNNCLQIDAVAHVFRSSARQCGEFNFENCIALRSTYRLANCSPNVVGCRLAAVPECFYLPTCMIS